MMNNVSVLNRKRSLVMTKERCPKVSTGLTLMPMSLKLGQELMRTVKAVPKESITRRMPSSSVSAFCPRAYG